MLSINAPLNLEELEDLFSQCKAWEQRYRQLLLLSKKLPPLADKLRTEDHEIKGCESKVWLIGAPEVSVWSEAKIINGLLVIMLTSLSRAESVAQAKSLYQQSLAQWQLEQHLSQSRNDGIEQIWKRLTELS